MWVVKADIYLDKVLLFYCIGGQWYCCILHILFWNPYRAFGRFIDGGLISNNPTLDILTEIFENNTTLVALGRESEVVQPTIIVSLGTGRPPVTRVSIRESIYNTISPWYNKLHIWDRGGRLLKPSLLNPLVVKSDGNNKPSLFYMIVHSLICISKYVHKDCIAWI